MPCGTICFATKQVKNGHIYTFLYADKLNAHVPNVHSGNLGAHLHVHAHVRIIAV